VEFVMPGHSPSRTGVNALMARHATSYTLRKQDVDGRDEPGHDVTREGNMLEQLAERVNADTNLVRRGRHVDTTFMLAIDDAYHLIRVSEGRIVSIRHGPFITPNYSFALRASRDSWEKFWSPQPLPGFTDIFALVKKKLLRIEGDLHPLMSNLLYFKGVLAAAGRAAKEAA
jgi:hypothetical protein